VQPTTQARNHGFLLSYLFTTFSLRHRGRRHPARPSQSGSNTSKIRQNSRAGGRSLVSLPRVPAKVPSPILCRRPSCNANRWSVEFTAYALASPSISSNWSRPAGPRRPHRIGKPKRRALVEVSAAISQRIVSERPKVADFRRCRARSKLSVPPPLPDPFGLRRHRRRRLALRSER
jgi:hypothetical protein